MSDEATPTETPQRKFVVKLVQTVPEHEVVAEQFEYAVDNKKIALQTAQNFIDDEKDMDGVTYRLEVEEILPTEESDESDEPKLETVGTSQTPREQAQAEA